MNGNNFLLDTNVVLGFLNGNARIAAFFQKKLIDTRLHVSQITRMELLGFPDITSPEEEQLKKFLSHIKLLPVTDAICDQAIHLRKSIKLKLPDALIAATAIHFDLVLITCDAGLLGRSSHFNSINPLN